MKKNSNKIIYFDYASATPIDKKVSKLITLYNNKYFANPSSIHKSGIVIRQIIENARLKISKLLYAHPDEIIFTGSGTQSDALAVLGIINYWKLKIGNNKEGKVPHIITTTIEHPAVLENCRKLEKNGYAEVTYISPDSEGVINVNEIKEALKENTVLISVMYANNEIGTVQPIRDIAKAIRHFRKSRKSENQFYFPVLHSDACQAMNYLEVENIEKLGVDLLTFNGSKIYGPKGVGILFKKRGVTIEPFYEGGGQEFGLNSGTENASLIAATALALEQTIKIKAKESLRLISLRDYGIKKLLELSNIYGYKIILNGSAENRLPNNINISILGISSELLVIELDAQGIEVSAKSACKSDEPDESYVITALRKAQNTVSNTTDGSIRISLGRQTTKKDIDYLVLSLKDILTKYIRWK
ncbi:MAG: cysteine desulfurase [Patescibacteria group bacterium]|nr:cysteine desulfurase [Patescibacteria group bacterium]